MEVFSALFSNIWSIFLVILFFGGSIFVHELGHFLAARKRGLKVERFSIGFGPKLFGWTKDGVDYRVSLLPLGGYVALPQLADLSAIEGESQQKVNQLPPVSYTSKMIVAVMGAVFNMIFAFFLATILWIAGHPTTELDQTTTIGYVCETLTLNETTDIPGPAHLAGLLPGDKVLTVDGESVRTFNDIRKQVVMGTGRTADGKPQVTFTVQRNGQNRDIVMQPQLMQINSHSGDEMRKIGIAPSQTLLIQEVMENSPAAKAGIQKGDILIAAEGEPLYSLNTFIDKLRESPKRRTEITLQRADETFVVSIKPKAVPYTKPLGIITFGEVETIELVPHYIEETPAHLVEMDTPASLAVFAITDGPKETFPRLSYGDTLVAIDGEAVGSLEDFTSENLSGKLLAFKNSAGKTYTLEMPKQAQAAFLPAKTELMVGIQTQVQEMLVHINPIDQFGDNVAMTFKTLGSLLHKDSDINVQNLMGPPGIVRVLHTFTTTDLRLVLWFTILLNINLAILNLLPIPVLDGGLMLYATIGKLRGRPLSEGFVASTQGVFMILLFSMMIYVSFFDIRRWQGDNDQIDQIERAQAYYIHIEFPPNHH